MLKPGGLLCNFDADWYGHLYDEEKRSGYEKDRQRVEEKIWKIIIQEQILNGWRPLPDRFL